MPSALQLAEGDPALVAAVRRGRQLLHRRALMSAVAGAVPLPGLDWAVDAALLTRLIPQINTEFGLSAEQLERLTPHKREQMQKAIAVVGSVLIGRLVTRELILQMARTVGLRMTSQQAAKYVPVAGQAVAAVMSYATLRYLGEEHMKDCVRVARAVRHLLPAPETNAARGPGRARADR